MIERRVVPCSLVNNQVRWFLKSQLLSTDALSICSEFQVKADPFADLTKIKNHGH